MARTAEFVMGLLGGIFGILAAIAAILFGGLGSAFGASGAESIIGLGFAALVMSIIGIVGAALVKSKNKRMVKSAGGIMIVGAIGGIIAISLFYVLSFVLLLIAGLMAIFRKEK